MFAAAFAVGCGHVGYGGTGPDGGRDGGDPSFDGGVGGDAPPGDGPVADVAPLDAGARDMGVQDASVDAPMTGDAFMMADASLDASAGCPGGWTRFRDECYLAVETPATDWESARLACEAMGAHLVVLADDLESEHVRSMFTPTLRFWIGLSDLAVEGTFVWVTGEMLTYTSWADGEPNAGSQDCVEVIDSRITWNENLCDDLNGYACEQAALP